MTTAALTLAVIEAAAGLTWLHLARRALHSPSQVNPPCLGRGLNST